MITFAPAQIEAWLAGAFLPFIRILALFSAAPILSNRAFPARARVALAAAITVVVAPMVTVPADITLGTASSLGWMAQQVCVGLALGFAARLVFAAFEIAGEAVGLQMGLSFAGYFSPSGAHQSAVSSWLNTLAMMAFVALNGHLLLLDALVSSFQVFPIAAEPMQGMSLLPLNKLLTEIFRMAVLIALPPSMLLLFLNFVLGYVSRVAPQLNIIAVGFPLTLLAGLSWLVFGSENLTGPLDAMLMTVLSPLR